MAKNAAIVTIAVGERCERAWRNFAKDNWVAYAKRHDLDLVVIDKPLDDSSRAGTRSPAWQKCLIFRDPRVAAHSRVAWVDADIVINPNSPCIFDSVPSDCVGAVDEFSAPSVQVYQTGLERITDGSWHPFFSADPGEYHRLWGLPTGFSKVVQSGVMVMSRDHHSAIMEDVYRSYEDKGDARWHYEMRPLSYELQSRCKMYWLDPRFNMLWAIYREVYYPFLGRDPRFRWATSVGDRFVQGLVRRFKPVSSIHFTQVVRECVKATLHSGYFLHFAGASGDMSYLPR